MCGISGFIDFNGQDRDAALARLKRMTNTLTHRGPDESGYYVDEHAALGHRRLSIIDLSSGQQPMSALNGQVQIVFNGEIYNYLELRTLLEGRGYRFYTHCDTEVILVGYLEWGERCIDRFNGMFAIAIWDARYRKLVLARDRVGKKPLYYYRHGGVVAFASELKAIQAGGFGSGVIDAQSIDCYFTFGYIPAPRTIYLDVRKLRPSRCLTIASNSEKERQYWHLHYGSPVERTIEDAVDEFESLLDDAVKIRLMSDVPLGAFLSGGIDSSLVVSSMVRQMGSSVTTNSIGFDDRQFNELPVANSIASYLKTDHHEYVVNADVSAILNKIAWYFDEPFSDSSAVPTWYVCEMAKKRVTVALSGDGGDESFGGYTFRYIPHMLEAKFRARLPPIARQLVFGPLGSLWPASAKLPKPLRLKTIFQNLSVSDAEAFYRDLACISMETRNTTYTGEFIEGLKGFTPMEVIYSHYNGNDAPDALGRSQYSDINFYMTDDVLVKVDRMSMAHSLEVRSPLLDYRIMEFAAKLPVKQKIDKLRGKILLRRSVSRRLPSYLLDQPKRGFSIPAAKWLREELRPLIESVIFRQNSYISDVLHRREVRRIWDEHLSERRDHSVFLWGLLMLGMWEHNYRNNVL
jgi:asparagine synthase (glutamine-hydrolysing)